MVTPADSASDIALFGKDETPRIVAIHPLLNGGPAQVRVYQRSEDFSEVLEHEEPFFPFFFLSDAKLLNGFPREQYQIQALEGKNFYQYVVVLRTWGTYWDAVRHIERAVDSRERRPEELYLINNPVQQYLTQTGRTSFLGMTFDELHRLQLDIEVATDESFPNAGRPEDAVIIVSLSDSRGWRRLLDTRAVSERVLLEELVRVIREKDPDVIEGHNIYQFDFAYLMKRCELHGVTFGIGRDGSVPRVFPSSMRFAERTIDFPALEIAGRHVVDTYFLVMSYDVFKRNMPGYGLKAAARHFGFAPEGRTYVDGADIARVWREDPERLLAYALDDVIETERLARHLSGSTFYLTQMLPMLYGQVARTGPAAKIEALFVREYLRQRHSLPRPEWGSQAVGGYTDVFVTGVVGPVIYADVESLYPSIMLGYDVRPKDDALGLFPDLLRRLTALRFDAKDAMNTAASDEEKGELDARQSSYKILINCFDGETEVVTIEGIKKIGDVALGDEVYSLNPETQEVEIKPVVATYAQYYKGPMVEMKARFIDYLVTPNHRMLTQKFTNGVNTPLGWEEAKDIVSDRTPRRFPPVSAWISSAPATRHLAAQVSSCEGVHTIGFSLHSGSSTPSGLPREGGDPERMSMLPGWTREGRRPLLKSHQRRVVGFEGMIYCVTVADNHTLLAGRNGKLNWCGQSFYGNLGFGLAAFNDFAEADRVAATGQEILRQIIRLIRREGGKVIEVDTDGVLFIPPNDVRGEEAERAFVEKLNEEMPAGIRIGFDGRFRTMLSYKKKNYALLTYDGHLKYKGSSLVARSNERFGRRFVREAIQRLLDEDIQGLHDLYVETRQRIIDHDWKGVESFSRTETLKETVEQYLEDVEAGRRTRAAAYELAIARSRDTGQPVRKGDRISYYVTGTIASVTTFENSRLTDAWDAERPDENTAYYLKRLDEFARKFEPFFSEHDFRLIFSPEDLFGFSPKGIAILSHERTIEDVEDEVPF